MDTEAFEQGDEALDEESRLDDSFIEQLEQDPSLDPTLQADELELAELGAAFDDPVGGGTPPARPDDVGWDLDQPLARGTEEDENGA